MKEVRGPTLIVGMLEECSLFSLLYPVLYIQYPVPYPSPFSLPFQGPAGGTCSDGGQENSPHTLALAAGCLLECGGGVAGKVGWTVPFYHCCTAQYSNSTKVPGSEMPAPAVSVFPGCAEAWLPRRGTIINAGDGRPARDERRVGDSEHGGGLWRLWTFSVVVVVVEVRLRLRLSGIRGSYGYWPGKEKRGGVVDAWEWECPATSSSTTTTTTSRFTTYEQGQQHHEVEGQIDRHAKYRKYRQVQHEQKPSPS